MKTRPMVVSDLPAITILLDVFEPNDPERFAEKWLGGWPRENDGGMVALDESGQIAGACWFRLFDSPPELIIGVRSEDRGKGVGRRLLPATVAQAKDLGVWALKAPTRPGNDRVHRLLEDFDFCVVVRTSRCIEYLRVLDDRVVAPPGV